MPLKTTGGGSGYTLDPLTELANTATQFNYRAEVIVRVAVEALTDADADKIADALERRRRKRGDIP